MITTGDTNISGYGSRTISIEVTGVRRQDVMRTSNYTVKVPYSRMSQTIQNINRMGGKVASVSLGGTAPQDSDATSIKESQEQSNKSSGDKENQN